jgi:hypothetical protein
MMVETEKKLASSAKALIKKVNTSASSKVRAAADLNADGTVDSEDARIAAQWTKQKGVALGKGASEAAKSALSTELGKDVAAAAAIGAAVAVPVPIAGPLAGAAVGAAVGVYRNRKKKRWPSR